MAEWWGVWSRNVERAGARVGVGMLRGGGAPLNENRNRSFFISSFLRSFVYSFLHCSVIRSEAPKIQRFKVSEIKIFKKTIACLLDDSVPYHQNSISCFFERYWFHIQDFEKTTISCSLDEIDPICKILKNYYTNLRDWLRSHCYHNFLKCSIHRVWDFQN